MPTKEDSAGSEVADSSTILVIEVLSADFSAWKSETDGSGLKKREARLHLRLRDVIKGRIRQSVGETFELTVPQRGTGGMRVMDFYGVWSHVPLSSGVGLVAFCNGEADDVRVLLSQDHCSEIAGVNEVYADTKAAEDLEKKKLAAPEVVALAARVASRYGDVFARLVWEEVRVRALSDPTVFDQLMRITENPATNAKARQTYLSRAYEELGLHKRAPRNQEIRLAQAMFRVLELPEGRDLKQSIAEVYLPNLLGLATGKQKYTAAEVLTSALDPTRLAQSIAKASTKSRAQAVTSWLQEGHK